MYRILFADDESKLREAVFDYCTAKGLCVFLAPDGAAAVRLAQKTAFDLILLDVMMPQMNGLAACAEIRKTSAVPILFLSALGEEQNLLRGYGAGADDYIVKPFPLSVLHEKILATIRRSKGLDRTDSRTLCGFTLHTGSRSLTVDGKEQALTDKDFRLLLFLAENKNRVLTRGQILDRVWGCAFDGGDRVVDTHIKQLRKLLGSKKGCIRTVPHVGYCLQEEEEPK